MGDAVLPSAGDLEGFTPLIHAAVLDKYDMNPLFLLKLKERTPESVLRSATRRSLELAADAGLSGLVVKTMRPRSGGIKSEK